MADLPRVLPGGERPEQGDGAGTGDGASADGTGSAASRPERPGRRLSGEERRRIRQPVTLPEVRRPRSTLRRRVYELVSGVERRAETQTTGTSWIGAYIVRVSAQVIRQWARDRCPQQAASLAFQTVLSIVPLLAVALAVLRLSGNIDAESSLVQFLAQELIPVSREDIAGKLTEWSGNINIQSLGIVGLVSTVLLAFVTINSMEGTINAIWRSERKRLLTQKFVVFYATITLGPFLIGTSLYQAARFGLTGGWGGLVMSVLISFGALLLANYALPSMPVRIGPAALGALVTTVLFESAKYAFNLYVTHFAFVNYEGVYGTLAVVPLWLVWIYYSWLTFLLGIEVAHAAQNMHLLQRRDRRRALSLENELIGRVNGVVAARVMAAICTTYVSGEKVMPRRVLEDIFDLSTEVLTRLAARLKEHDLLIEVEGEHSGYLPARPPSEITLAEVLAVFRGEDLIQLTDRPRTRLDHILAEIDESTRTRTGAVSFAELIDGP